MNKKYTGKQIIKAGEMLLDYNIEEFDSAMDILSYWRFSHEKPLGEALKILQETTIKIDKNAIFAKRLKRYVSIVYKLRRFRKMKLKNMQDIGGCRAIISSPRKCWRRLKTDHPYRLKIDQGELLNSVLYSIGIVDQTELVLPPFFY